MFILLNPNFRSLDVQTESWQKLMITSVRPPEDEIHSETSDFIVVRFFDPLMISEFLSEQFLRLAVALHRKVESRATGLGCRYLKMFHLSIKGLLQF